MLRSKFEATYKLQTTEGMIVKSRKIDMKDSFMFINERNKGFYIIDNTGPTSPQNMTFLNV